VTASAGSASLLPGLAVLLPALAVPGIYLFDDRPNAREAVTFLAALALLVVTGLAAAGVLGGARFVTDLGTLGVGVGLVLRADPLGAFFATLAAFLWLVTSLYSVGYMRGLDEGDQTRYFAAFAASLAATMGVAFAANLLTLFVFYELLTVATYPLVAHAGDEAARGAARKYLAYTLGGGLAVFAGTVLVLLAAGSTTFAPGGIAALAGADPLVARAAFACLAAGFGVKTALLPFQSWLPSAMVAPTPVSGLLHAVAVVKSGAFGLARVVLFVFGPDLTGSLGAGAALATVAALTAVLAGVVALRQTKLKRALAYSTVSQLSYIALGLGVGHPLAAFGAILHVAAHAFMKITLFFGAGALYVETGVQYLDGLPGIARRMPATAAAFGVAAVGLAGLPLVAGFLSKLYLVLGSVRAGRPLLAGALLVAGFLKLLLFWPMLSAAFFGSDPGTPATRSGEPPGVVTDGGDHDGDDETIAGDRHDDPAGPPGGWERRTPRTEGSLPLVLPVLVVAACAVVLGVVPSVTPPWDLAAAAVREAFGTGVIP
jgi:NADH-quinone oxidoreductase subunit L/multicomponent Na+:H+ antiporter subunit D